MPFGKIVAALQIRSVSERIGAFQLTAFTLAKFCESAQTRPVVLDDRVDSSFSFDVVPIFYSCEQSNSQISRDDTRGFDVTLNKRHERSRSGILNGVNE
jgi:hypothetical protein